MKAQKKIWIFFTLGLIVGGLLTGAIMKTYYKKCFQTPLKVETLEPIAEETQEDVDEKEEIGKNEEKKNEIEETSTQEVEKSDNHSAWETWDSSVVYVGGDEVEYQGKVYRAKWWTQNEEPGKIDVWEDLMIAAESPVIKDDDEGGLFENLIPRTDVAKSEDFKVVGYFPSWSDKIDKIQFDVLTHINYAFAIPNSDGTLKPLENASVAKKIISKAHENGVEVFIAVGGWSYHDVPLESTFMDATSTKEKRELFVNSIVQICEEYGFDGVDMDWEHPRVDGTSAKQYEDFMLQLSEDLHSNDKKLSAAVLSGATADGNVYYDAAAHSDKVLNVVDWINVMAYDGGDGERHSSYEFAVNCGKYWSKTRKLSPEKITLGVPFYSRPGWASYDSILQQVSEAWENDHVDFNGMDVWYNGCKTIEDKTNYAIENLGGVMIWEVSQDSSTDKSLQTVIGRTVKEHK